MTWGAVAVGVGGAVIGGISSSQSNKRAKAAGNGLNEAIAYARRNPGVFGEKLDFAALDYQPLFQTDPGYAGLAGEVISGNQRNLPAATQLASDTNDAITQNNLDRINKLYPGFGAAFEQQASNTQNFLRGDIPQEDRDLLTSRRTEAQSLGGTGVNQQQVAADLGLARLDLMKDGAAALTNNVNLWDAIDPQRNQMMPQSLFVDVGAAINSAINENQFDSTFAQAERNAELNFAMMPDPRKAGMLNLIAARGGAQAANPQQSILGGMVTGGLTAGMGAYQNNAASAFGQRQAAPAYVPSSRMTPAYASPQDQTLGFQSLSGTWGPGTPNYNTGATYAQQGSQSLWFPNQAAR